MHILENDHYRIEISSLGAELKSVFHKELDKELLWQADKNIWARHAPVLFPIVGRLKNDTYYYEGKAYHLPQHGFARDREFKLVKKSFSTVILELSETDETLISYPFRFKLVIEYSVDDRDVSCKYTVHNPGNKVLFFSIGAHPGFVCPLFDYEKMSDYKVLFNKEETSQRRLLQDGLVKNVREEVFETERSFRLSSKLFEKDAIVFDDLKSTHLELYSNSYLLYFSWFNMPYFGIWTKKGTEQFVCIEPWAGIADHIGASGNIEEKEGIIALDPDKEFTCGFSFSGNSAREI